LESETYQVDRIESFKEQVQKFQEIGREMLDFREGAPPDILLEKIDRLRKLAAGDADFLRLADELASCLKSKKNSKQNRIVSDIQTHLRHTYRLHPRILRNRRNAVEDVMFDRDLVPKNEYDLNDEQWSEIHSLLDNWRNASPKSIEYQRIFLLFFRAGGTWLNILERVIKARLQEKSTAEIDRDFGKKDAAILTGTKLFSGERELLENLLNALQKPQEGADRMSLLRIAIIQFVAVALKIPSQYLGNPRESLSKIQERIKRQVPGDRFPKIVIFSSFTTTCQEIADSLTKIFGKKAVAIHQKSKIGDDAAANLQRFKTEPNCWILACDRSIETGLNLQFADWLIHFDLPWFPDRLEQRLSRVDRIGSKMGVQFSLFAGPDMPDSLYEAWFKVLKDGFGIFNKSIANLQVYIGEKLPQLEEKLFVGGAKALLAEIELIKNEIDREQIQIDAQYALDEIDLSVNSASEYFSALEDGDANHQEIQQAAEGWICQALNFKRIEHPNLSGLLRYQPSQKTLITSSDLTTKFIPHFQRYGTYNRRIANQHSDVNLYRIGEGSIEAFDTYIRWDDRGQAFAMWRHDESWDAAEGKEWFGFQFNYSIATDLQPAEQVLQKQHIENYNLKTLQRRTDAFLPPILETVFAGASGAAISLVEDAETLKILQRSYKGKGGPNRDYNLSKNRTSVIDSFVKPEEWEAFCQQGRKISEELLRKQVEFKDKCDRAAESAKMQLQDRVDRMQLRSQRLSASVEEIGTETALIEAIVTGIRQPRISLESVGFIVISGRPPVKSEDD
ncbi:MAG: protein DpdE, partial [Microcoleus sp.]